MTLTGAVPSYSVKTAAAEDARVISGVVRVDDRLEVAYPALPADQDIRRDVVEAFRRDPVGPFLN